MQKLVSLQLDAEHRAEAYKNALEIAAPDHARRVQDVDESVTEAPGAERWVPEFHDVLCDCIF